MGTKLNMPAKSGLGYQWQWNECNSEGIPYVKLAPVVLERDGVCKTFTTQAEVDAAWADGWHDTNRPHTADVLKGKAQRTKLYPKSPKSMGKPELMLYMEELNLEYHEGMTNGEMKLDLTNEIKRRQEAEGDNGDDGGDDGD